MRQQRFRMKEEEFISIIEGLRKVIIAQGEEILALKEEIRVLKEGRDSGNSSMPPSADLKRHSRSLRRGSGKKPGGQPGHEGRTLEMKAVADHVVVHSPSYCTCCGEDLSGIGAVLLERRQVVDIPPVAASYTEHRVYGKKCRCGHETRGTFPAHVTSAIQYGAGIEATAAYMSARQFVPYARMCEYFAHVHRLPISEGSISNMLGRFAAKAKVPYRYIKDGIARTGVVGADETGCKVNGGKQWVFTWQSPKGVLLSVAKSRGYGGINGTFPNGLPDSILVSDAWAAQMGTAAKGHQLCMAHLLRDLNYFVDVLRDNWSEKVRAVIEGALELKGRLAPADYMDEATVAEREELEGRLDSLLGQQTDNGKVTAFKKRLVKYRGHIFEFLRHHEVPPDNNASERAIRNVKVKQKVSCQFKSQLGAEIFVTIRSIIDTCIRRDIDIFQSLVAIANYRAE